MTWLIENMGTIIVLLVLVIIVAAIVRKLHADKKKGIHSCGGHCGGGCRGAHPAAEAVPLALRTRNKQC